MNYYFIIICLNLYTHIHANTRIYTQIYIGGKKYFVVCTFNKLMFKKLYSDKYADCTS